MTDRRTDESGTGPESGPVPLRLKQLEEELRWAQSAIVCGLNQLLDLRDLNTGCHSTRLAEWAVRLAVDFGFDERYQRNVEVACLLHDIGKIGMPDSILRKKGPLTPKEQEEMRRHPEYGWTILRFFPDLELAGLFTLHHHERFDGAGYPAGLRGDKIPLGARIVSVVDAFDAMLSDRCYRPGLALDEAVSRLVTSSGAQFDPDIVKQFVELARSDHFQVARVADPSAR